MAVPYQCSKCMNWYVAIPLGPDEFCMLCDRGTHIAHPKTGIIDCHFGEQSAHPSEIGMATLLNTLGAIRDRVGNVLPLIESATSTEEVKELLSEAEATANSAEKEERKAGELMRWAGIFELPGMMGAAPAARFKSTEVIETYVAQNRRPPEDLAYLRRSVSNCQAMEERIPSLMGGIRATLFDVRNAANNWKAPQAIRTPMPVAERMAKARAARKLKELVNA